MRAWRYKVIPMTGGPSAGVRSGDMVAESAAEVRASLRRLGLLVVDLRALRAPRPRTERGAGWTATLRERVHRALRARRRVVKAELFDSLATLLESGVPLVECLETQMTTARGSQRRRTMVVDLRAQVRSGAGLSEAMARHPDWFDPVETAIIRSGEMAGELTRLLGQLSARYQRSETLQQRMATALVYPCVIAVAGLLVVVFLSIKTLPELSAILMAADVEPPRLTRLVAAVGQVLARGWMWLGIAALATLGLGPVLWGAVARSSRIGATVSRWVDRLTPAFIRRTAVAGLAQGLAELVEAGVPLSEALRLIAPTTRSFVLRMRVVEAVQTLERGGSLGDAFADARWFDAEFRRLLEVGQMSGRLEELLKRLAERHRRRGERAIDRLAALLEPAAIIALAILIGIVVMAAIQPLIRLQEVV